MANTYTQIHIHVVFSVQNRKCLIKATWKDSLFKYITGIIQKHDHKVLAINGVSDHVHILIGMRPTQSLSDLMQDIKGSSSKWVNNNNLVAGKFAWQAGFGAFSYAKSDLTNVISYIQNQEEHHKKTSFTDEFVDFLKEFGVNYNELYIFNKLE